MKVAGVEPSSCDKLLVPTGVSIVGCVKRLMHVPNEMQKNRAPGHARPG
jgi:hypothetical protein